MFTSVAKGKSHDRESSPRKQNYVVWMRRKWNLERNPFPQGGVTSFSREDNRENGRLFRPEVQADKIPEAVDKFVVGAAFSGLKFGYLWSVSGPATEDYRGYGKSSMLQYLVEETNKDFGRGLLTAAGFTPEEAEEAAICAMLASFDTGINRSLAAVFHEATEYACRHRNPKTKHEAEGKTLAQRLYDRLVAKLGSDDPTVLVDAVMQVSDSIRGRTLGPPLNDFIQLLCAGDSTALGRYVQQVKSGARTRVGAANFLATFLLFAKAADVSHVLLGMRSARGLRSKDDQQAEAHDRDGAVPRFRARAHADGGHAYHRRDDAPARRGRHQRDVAARRPAQHGVPS